MSSSQKKRMFTVPYEFCRYVVKFGLFREASVYLMLKYMCDGRIEINSSVLTKVSQSLKISQRTVKRVLEWLTANDWIRNAYGKTYRVISFNRLYFNVRLGKSKIGIIWDDPDFIDTKAFIITACVSKILYVKSGKKRASAKGIDAQTILPAWANQVLRFSRKKEFDLNRNYLSKSFFATLIEIPLTTAYDYINYAVKSGFILKTRHYLLSKYSIMEAKLARKYASYCGGNRLVFCKGKVEILLPNSFESSLVLRPRYILRRLEKKI